VNTVSRPIKATSGHGVDQGIHLFNAFFEHIKKLDRINFTFLE
jgi:predicted RND superfamily exporter protein